MSATADRPNRRDAYRLVIPLRVAVFEPVACIGSVIDISVSGTLFGFDLPCAIGDNTEFSVTIPSGDKLELAGTVVRRDGQRTAVRLQGLTLSGERALSSMIADEQRERMRRYRSRRCY